MSAPTKLNVHTRASFVRPAVKEIPVTTTIINSIIPYFPKDCICISGYLDNSDQYWKVNYHWDLLTFKIDEFLARPDIDAKFKGFATAIKGALLTNCPVPRLGYRTDKVVGGDEGLEHTRTDCCEAQAFEAVEEGF